MNPLTDINEWTNQGWFCTKGFNMRRQILPTPTLVMNISSSSIHVMLGLMVTQREPAVSNNRAFALEIEELWDCICIASSHIPQVHWSMSSWNCESQFVTRGYCYFVIVIVHRARWKCDLLTQWSIMGFNFEMW